MTLIQDSPKKKQPIKSCFLSCFGFSKQQKDKVESVRSKKKQSSCFSFKIFQRKQSPEKTVPVDITTVAAVEGGAEKLNQSREIYVLKSEKKAAVKKRQLPAATTVYAPQVPVNGQTIHFNKFNKAKHEDIILEKSKKLEHCSCQKGLFRSFTIANGDKFITCSAEDKHEISRTVSLPPPPTKQPVLAIDEEKDTYSVFGMSILMVTLIIMLFWGKFCAIVCTSAWFYLLPKFRVKNEALIAGQNGGNLDVSSDEYKKKVVFNGFLERDHKNVVGF